MSGTCFPRPWRSGSVWPSSWRTGTGYENADAFLPAFRAAICDGRSATAERRQVLLRRARRDALAWRLQLARTEPP